MIYWIPVRYPEVRYRYRPIMRARRRPIYEAARPIIRVRRRPIIEGQPFRARRRPVLRVGRNFIHRRGDRLYYRVRNPIFMYRHSRSRRLAPRYAHDMNSPYYIYVPKKRSKKRKTRKKIPLYNSNVNEYDNSEDYIDSYEDNNNQESEQPVVSYNKIEEVKKEDPNVIVIES